MCQDGLRTRKLVQILLDDMKYTPLASSDDNLKDFQKSVGVQCNMNLEPDFEKRRIIQASQKFSIEQCKIPNENNETIPTLEPGQNLSF